MKLPQSPSVAQLFGVNVPEHDGTARTAVTVSDDMGFYACEPQ
jgi:hypothetical protein